MVYYSCYLDKADLICSSFRMLIMQILVIRVLLIMVVYVNAMLIYVK
nr:MAG TPA: hypothetical protein [Caudoviricetes sp.]